VERQIAPQSAQNVPAHRDVRLVHVVMQQIAKIANNVSCGGLGVITAK
jgi:hypothetical protein